VVLVLAGVLTESDDLRRSRLACDIETSHLNARAVPPAFTTATCLRPPLIDRFRNRNDLWIRT
jgi:hypothetical protein